MRRPVAAGVVVTALLALPATALAGPERRPVTSTPPAAAAAKPAAKLRVRDLSRSSATVAAGTSLMVRGRVRSTARRSSTPTVSVFLAKAKTGRISLGSGRVGRVPAGRGARFAVKVRVPASIGSGKYNLVVCARVSFRQTARCATAPRALPVTKPKPAAPQPAPAPAPVPATPAAPGPAFADGARSIGDSLFPAIGNGGYDALGYALNLSYEPATKVLQGTSTMTAVATQDLRSFSLDLQGLDVTAVTVGAAPAFFTREDTKLIVTPPAGVTTGSTFAVTVAYGGVETPVIDPDGSSEGWIPTDTGAVVVNEPIGAQGWFPNNNTPRDKATFDVTMSVPQGLEVIGNGVLRSRSVAGGRETFNWVESQPMATYLSTATVGDYAIRQGASPAGVPIYAAADRAANTRPDGRPLPAALPQQVAANLQDIIDGGEVVDFFADFYGPYPFETSGGIIANARWIGYALEVQGRPVYTSNSAGALVHELAHQWWGDEATLTDWRDIWLAEGFAVWSEWYYDQEHNGDTTAEAAAAVYATPVDDDPYGTWRPLIVTDGEFLFGNAPYDRGGAMLEALRQKIGPAAFTQVLRNWLNDTAYGNGTTEGFVALAEKDSGQDLQAFFQDWLYTDGKPTTDPPVATP